MRRFLLYSLLFAAALTMGSCRRSVERVAQKIRFEGVEQVERLGLTGLRMVVRVDNGSAYRLTLSSAKIELYYADACVGNLLLEEPVEIDRRSEASLTTRWRLRISDPLALYVLARKVRAGEYGQIFLSCAMEGRGGPAPVRFSRERMPLSDFLNIFGLSVRDVENYLK